MPRGRQDEDAVRAITEAAKELGIGRSTLEHRLKEAKHRGFDEPAFSIAPLAEEEISREELLERKDKDWARRKKARSDRKLINVQVDVDGPFGLIFFGDPHLDDDNNNWDLLKAHTELVKDNRDILFSVLAGDITNNWIGVRLTHKWKEQTVTARQSEMLLEWWLEELGDSVMLAVMGNHDHWSRPLGGGGKSLFEWLMIPRPGLIEAYEVNASLDTPSEESFTIHLRHHFKGSSIYNRALAGMAKQVRLAGRWPDIMACGHWHTSQFTQMMNPSTQRVTHAVRVSGYKVWDDYADREEFLDHTVYESAIAVCNPYEKDQRYRVRLYDPFHGVKVLKMMREEWAKSHNNSTP